MLSENKRIAYNTVILYFKLIMSVVIGLYTSRLILQALGASDYGLYTLVGGIVSLLNIIGVTMVSTSYRYINVEIGKGEIGDPHKIYNTIFVIHIALAIMLIVLGIIIGYWYIGNYLNVDPEKLSDARYVLTISMFTTAFSVISVPSNGLIIAREKFLFTTLIEMIQTIFRLGLVLFVLRIYGGNRLRLYANMMAIVTLIAPIAYTSYCYTKEYAISKWKFNNSWKDYIEILSFTGWMLISTMSFMGVAQGAAMIINFFFGTVINAAYGISSQIHKYLIMAPRNILQAATPQIMQNYSEGNHERALNLVYLCTKYCFFVFMLLTVPCLLFMNEILNVWLDDVPPQTSIFTTFMIIATLIGSLTNGLDPLIMASGKIRLFQLGYAIIFVSLLPIIYILYMQGYPAYSNTIVLVVLTITSVVFQLYVACRVTSFKLHDYFRITLLPALLVLLFNMPLFILRYRIHYISLPALALGVSISLIWCLTSIYMFGLKQDEKEKVKKFIVMKQYSR